MAATHQLTTTNGTGPSNAIPGAIGIRQAYTRHFLKAHLQGFKPMDLREFIGVLASINLAK